jgi:quercetin dioxygenase-like cupin family protein
MNVESKVWGTTSLLFRHNSVEIHRIEGKAGGFCSRHHHRSKYNKFIVESGKLSVKIWRGDDVQTHILEPQQILIIDPGEWHQFEIIEDKTVAYEVYWTALDTTDIVRDGVGGLRSTVTHCDRGCCE